MNFKVDDLLDQVDEWKFQLHEKLRTLTPKQRAAFWQGIMDQACAAGLAREEPMPAAKHPTHRTRRGTGRSVAGRKNRDV
jgi:hypothetical protein